MLNTTWVVVPGATTEPLNEPVNAPVNEPLNEPVFDKNWSTRFTVNITEGIPGVSFIGSAYNLIPVSADTHMI